MLVEMVAMTSMRVRETITLSWKLVTCKVVNINLDCKEVTSNRNVRNPTTIRMVCWRNMPRR